MFLLASIAWPYRGLRYGPIGFECFFEGIRWEVDTFQMIAGLSSIFFKCIWNKSCSWAALLKCWFRTDLGRENSTGFYIYMQGRQSLLTFLTVTHWSRSPSNSYFLIGKIWQVSSCGKFMQRLETCLLIAGADRVLCHLVLWCFKLSFSTWCTKWNAAAIKIVL